MAVNIEDHGMACALYGDCIYDVVQEGAKLLETKWKSRTSSWDSLIDKAVKTGFMGWGAPLVDRKWLSFVLFEGPRYWPSSLTADERQALKLAVAVSGFHRRYSKGVKIDRKRGITDDPDKIEEDQERTTAALRKYAELFKSKIGIPMWKDYQSVTKMYGSKIKPLCDEKYGEPCSDAEAENIFQGDLERGLKMKTLDVDPPTYRVLPVFIRWVS